MKSFPSKAPGQKQSWRLKLTPFAAAAVILAATVLVYLPALKAGFIWDDDDHLTKNACIVGPLGFNGIWTSSAAVYYPLVLTSFWLQHALWGLNPLPYHLVNILMHAACAVLLWRALRRLNVLGAWFAALLWALHPVQVESVAWITELKNTQSCMFYLLAILFFLKWRPSATPAAPGGKERHYALALICAALAILSKTSTVILPAVLVLCWWWLGGRWSWRNSLRLAPFFVISAAASGWTIWEQKFHSGALGPEWSQTWPERLVIAGNVVWFYLGKLLWPHPLIFIYPRWQINAAQPVAYLPGLAVALTLFVLWRYRDAQPPLSGRLVALESDKTLEHGRLAKTLRTVLGLPQGEGKATSRPPGTGRGQINQIPWHCGCARPLFFAFACFLVSLFPVLGFFNVYFFRYSFVGDHLQYLATLAMLPLLAAGLARLLRQWRLWKRWPGNLLCTTLLAVLAALAWSQCRMYHHLESLWRTTLERNPDCWMAHNNLGHEWAARERFKEAIEHYQEALRIKPDSWEAQNNFGVALQNLGRFDEARAHFEMALKLNPNHLDARNNLGLALLRLGRFDEAMAQFSAQLRLNPCDATACFNVANVLAGQGKRAEAIGYYRAALQLAPANFAIHNNLACLLVQERNFKEAAEHFSAALRLKPDGAATCGNLGSALFEQGRFDEAVSHLIRALKLNPGSVEAHYNLGNAYAALKKPPEALAQYQTALRLNPKHDWVHFKLGNLLLADGKPEAAAEEYRAALAANTNLAEAHYQLATLLIPRQEVEEGIKRLRAALRLKPNWVEPLNNLAWLLATHPEAKYRDGPEAVRLAAHAVELTRGKDAEALDTLAAAYAETGQFADAVKTVQEALSAAQTAGQNELLSQIRSRLKLYTSQRSYRQEKP